MASPLLPLSPECGERTLPALVDSIAQTDGDRPIVSISRTENLEDGYRDIDASTFARAVDFCAWWLDTNIKNSDVNQNVFYFGPLDIRYLIVMLGACKTGRVAFFSSHRNSMEAHLSLLSAANCGVALVPKKAPVVLEQILTERSMETLAFPDLNEFLQADQDTKTYRYRPSFDEVRDKPLVILHTSGSTGIPKPVYVTHGTFASNDAHQLIPSLGGRPTVVDYLRGRRFLVSLPLFHAACIGMWANSVFSGFTTVVPPPIPLTSDVVDMINTRANISGSLMPPSLIVDIFNNPKHLENMIQHLEFVCYVGGTLASEVGEYISRNLKLITLFGTTENMYYPLEIHDRPIDWAYISLSPQLGHVYRESREGVGELVIVRDDTKRKIQGVFSTFPTIQEYGTKDLYEQHPSRSNLRIFSGRSDDIICFNNAEKLNPITMEAIIMTHPEVSSAIIGGSGQFQASLLIEPKNQPTSDSEARALIERIWPTVVKANQGCPAHGRLVKNLIMLSDPERPLPKAGKTTVQRHATMELYRQDFEDIYTSKRTAVASEQRPAPPMQKRHVEFPVSKPIIKEIPSPGHSGLDFLSHSAQERLQGMIQEMVPEVFGSVVTSLCRDMLRSGGTPSIPLNNTYNSLASKDTTAMYTSSAMPPPPPHMTRSSSETEIGGMSEVSAGAGSHDIQDIKSTLHKALAKTTSLIGTVSDDANLFDHGLDSIQAPGFIEEVNSSLEEQGLAPVSKDEPLVQLHEVYEHPTIDQLATVLGSTVLPEIAR